MSGRRRAADSAAAAEDSKPAAKRPRLTTKKSTEGGGDPTGIHFSANDKSGVVTLSRDRRTMASRLYKLVRATRGVSSGAWFCEFTVGADLKPGAHVRLGWASDSAELHGPVGFDHLSYAYRDLGHRVHQSIVKPYGSAYGAGDVIGCLITFDTPEHHLVAAEAADDGASAGPRDIMRVREAEFLATRLPSASRADTLRVLFDSPEPPLMPPWAEAPSSSATTTAGAVSPRAALDGVAASGSSSSSSGEDASSAGAGGVAPPAPSRAPLVPPHLRAAFLASIAGSPAPSEDVKKLVVHRHWRSSMRFFVNGVDQGVAFLHLSQEHTSGGEGKFYPAASCYGGASVRFNPGPNFAYPVPGIVALAPPELARSGGAGAPPAPSPTAAAAETPVTPAAAATETTTAAATFLADSAPAAPVPCPYVPAGVTLRPISDLVVEADDREAKELTAAASFGLDHLQSVLGVSSAVALTFSGAATAALGLGLGGLGGGGPVGAGSSSLAADILTGRAAVATTVTQAGIVSVTAGAKDKEYRGEKEEAGIGGGGGGGGGRKRR